MFRTPRKGPASQMLSLLAVAAALAAAVAAGGYAYSEAAARRFEVSHPPAGRFVDVDGVRMHVIDWGPRDAAAAPVVLIHGASSNALDMRAALAESLATDRRVLIVDRPGHGYSARPDDGWRLQTQAQLIRGAVTRLGVERPVIVGQSFGGAVALAYVLNHPDEVGGLALLAPVSHEWPGGVAWYNIASGVPVIGIVLRRLVLPIYGPMLAAGDFASAFSPDPPPADYAARAGGLLLFRPDAFRSNAEDLRRLKAQIIDQQSDYAQIRTPTTIAAGLADTTVSPAIHAEELARDIDGAELVRLDGAGHPLHHVRQREVVEIIRRTAARARRNADAVAE